MGLKYANAKVKVSQMNKGGWKKNSRRDLKRGKGALLTFVAAGCRRKGEEETVVHPEKTNDVGQTLLVKTGA